MKEGMRKEKQSPHLARTAHRFGVGLEPGRLQVEFKNNKTVGSVLFH